MFWKLCTTCWTIALADVCLLCIVFLNSPFNFPLELSKVEIMKKEG